jgi:hypothetical protein
MKVSFYGAIAESDIIRKSIADVSFIGAGLADSDIAIERLTVEPDPLTTIGLPDSDYGFSETWTPLNA